MPNPTRRFCHRGHDTEILGRTKDRHCRACRRKDEPPGRPSERYCQRGHDTYEVGRDANYYCKECRRESDRRRSPKRRALEASISGRQGKHLSPEHIEWERARVKRWSEIITEDPFTEAGGFVGRYAEFDARYQKLEADVPLISDDEEMEMA